MTDPIALDVHTHLIPIEAEALAHFDGIAWNEAEQTLSVDGHTVAIKSLFQPQKLLQWMEDNTIAHAFVSLPPPVYRQHLRGDAALAWWEHLNAGLVGIAARSEALTPLIHLPTENPGLAADIVRRHGEDGYRHFSMPAGTGDDRTLGMPEFEPLWQALDDLGAFVFLHPGECADGRLQSFYLANLLGNPYESTVALAHLVFAGVLEKYPAIIPCLAHGGGLAPSVAARWQRGIDTARPGVPANQPAVSDLLSRVTVDCICHGLPAAIAAEETFGTHNVVFGSDWPFPMGLVAPHDQLASFGPERRHAYFQANADRLLKKLVR